MVKISGVWNLISQDYIYLPNNTSILQPFGPNPSGKLTMTNDGYISVVISNPDVARLPNGTTWSNTTDAQAATIAKAVVAYCGEFNTFHEGDQLVLTTVVDVSLNPEWVGTTQRRNVSFVEEDGENYMVLKPVGNSVRTLPVSTQPQMLGLTRANVNYEGWYQT
jgi:hypothetical protein